MKPVSFFDATPKERRRRWEEVIRVLRGLTRHQREKHWHMGVWGEKTECGTVACAAGHCGMDPWFRRRGIRLDFTPSWDGVGFDNRFTYGAANRFFGPIGYKKIFCGTGGSVSNVIKAIRYYLKTDGDFAEAE